MNWLSLISTLVALTFAGFVLYRYAYRGGAHLLLWGIGPGFVRPWHLC